MKTIRKQISGDKFFQLMVTIILTVFFIIELYPMLYVVFCSISNPDAVASGEVLLWPVGITLQGYQKVFQYRDLWIGYGNTIFYTLAGTALNLAITLPCAYAMSRKELMGRNQLMLFFMITMYVSGGLIPTYLNVKSFGLLDSRWCMVILGAISVYNMIVARTFFANSIPDEIIEAARIDGCNDFRIFGKIILPLSKAITGVLVLYYGTGHWNAYFDAMIYLDDRKKFPLQLFLREILIQSKFAEEALTDSTVSAEELAYLAELSKNADLMKYCIIIVSTVPLMFIYPKLQKFFEKGDMIGSVKG